MTCWKHGQEWSCTDCKADEDAFEADQRAYEAEYEEEQRREDEERWIDWDAG